MRKIIIIIYSFRLLVFYFFIFLFHAKKQNIKCTPRSHKIVKLGRVARWGEGAGKLRQIVLQR